MIKIFLETEVWENPEKGLAQMYENGRMELGFRCVKFNSYKSRRPRKKGEMGRASPRMRKGT
jgi:hypothetical protein